MTSDARSLEQYRDGRNLEARVSLHEHFSTNKVGLHPWLLAQVELPPLASVLELGCGVGSLWVAIRDRIPPGWRVTLTDVSPGMVSEAKRRPRSDGLGFTFAAVAADALTYPAATFDTVFAHFMLYHVVDRPRAISRMARGRSHGQLYAAANGARHIQEARLLAMNTGLMSPAEVAAGDAVGFSLENGAALLGTAFADVALRRYEDRLVVTESEQLLAYLMSSPQVQKKLTGLDPAERQEHVARLRALIDEQLEVHGQIVVTKDFRVFIVRRVWS